LRRRRSRRRSRRCGRAYLQIYRELAGLLGRAR
jgi:hypothetical protein